MAGPDALILLQTYHLRFTPIYKTFGQQWSQVAALWIMMPGQKLELLLELGDLQLLFCSA